MVDVLQNPRWQPGELGKPIPDSPYAVSTCLPTWASAVGYEEREPHVINALTGGYPRFVYHPICQKLFEACRQQFGHSEQQVLTMISAGAAARFSAYLHRQGGGCSVHDLKYNGVHAVCFDPHWAPWAKAYWQHTGEGTSARLAEACVNHQQVAPAPDAIQTIRQRLGDAVGAPAASVMLYPTGMTGIYALHRTLCELRPGRPSVQFGFPYVDTLKVLEKFGCSSTFFETGDDEDLARLEELMQSRSAAAVYTEVPSNPLLLTPDLPALAAICRRHRTPLVVDDTIATAVNVDLMQYADVICTSLTKFFSGQGDVAAGAVMVNPASPWADELAEAMRATGDTPLFAADAKVLVTNSGDWITRVRRINQNAEQLADHLAQHSAVARVHYPKFCARDQYEALRKPEGGYGGLMSMELHDPAANAPRFYDRIRCNKGPNLGTNYTLLCPYTILAHYDELAWAESCGVSRWLIRISVGLENIDDLIQRFDEALGEVSSKK